MDGRAGGRVGGEGGEPDAFLSMLKTAHQEDLKGVGGGEITLCCGKQIKAEEIMSPQEKSEQKVPLMKKAWERYRPGPGCQARLHDGLGRCLQRKSKTTCSGLRHT